MPEKSAIFQVQLQRPVGIDSTSSDPKNSGMTNLKFNLATRLPKALGEVPAVLKPEAEADWGGRSKG